MNKDPDDLLRWVVRNILTKAQMDVIPEGESQTLRKLFENSS
jgi:hypothetical protein